MKTARLLTCLLLLAGVLNGAEPTRPPAAAAATKSAPAAEAAEPEEVYIPEKPAPKPATPAADPNAKSLDAKAGPGAAGPKAVVIAPPPLSPRFQQVRDRIAALLAHRSEAPPKFDPKKNPFRPAGAGPAATIAVPSAPVVSPLSAGASGSSRPAAPPASTVDAPSGTPPSGDLALLQQAIATLKVAGTVQIGVVAHLVINQVPYKEGDIIIVKVKGQPVYLRVKNISRYSYTLALNETELSVKY